MPEKCQIIDRRGIALRGFAQSTLGTLFYPAYRAAFNSRRARFLHRREQMPGAPVIGIGGVSLGGSGKTPVVCALHDAAAKAGKRGAVVLKHGRDPRHFLDEFLLYATRFSVDGALKLTQGEGLFTAECGGTTVCAHKDKIEAARMLASRDGVDFVIVDDAHQLFSLQPALSICLLPADDKGKLFPRGLMREELVASARADILLARKEHGALPGLAVPQVLYSLETHGLLAASSLLAPWAALPQEGEKDAPPSPDKSVAFAGIGFPSEFEQSLSGNGTRPRAMVRFPDHHLFSLADLRMLERTRVAAGAEGFITTEKDACRLLPAVLRALHGEGMEVTLPEGLLPPPAHYLPDLIVAAQAVWARTSYLRVDAVLPDDVIARFLKVIGA
jgi:tetraacyldisaccharide 4'-kinase